MMRGIVWTASLLALAGPAVGQVRPDNTEILAAAQAFDDAQLHGDRATLERMLAADYLLVHGSGRVGDRKDFIDGFTDPKSHLEPFQITDRLFLRPSSVSPPPFLPVQIPLPTRGALKCWAVNYRRIAR